MAHRYCPIISAPQGALKPCLGENCMLYYKSSSGDACGLVKYPQQTNSKIDILSAQIQEIQVALNELVNKRLLEKS